MHVAMAEGNNCIMGRTQVHAPNIHEARAGMAALQNDQPLTTSFQLRPY